MRVREGTRRKAAREGAPGHEAVSPIPAAEQLQMEEGQQLGPLTDARPLHGEVVGVSEAAAAPGGGGEAAQTLWSVELVREGLIRPPAG